jgi:hypothetical protein
MAVDEQQAHVSGHIGSSAQAAQQYGAVAAQHKRSIAVADGLGDCLAQRGRHGLQAGERLESRVGVPLRTEHTDADITRVVSPVRRAGT